MRQKAIANAVEVLTDYKIDFRHFDVGCATLEEDETPFHVLCDSYMHIEGDLEKYDFIEHLERGFDLTLCFDSLRFAKDPFSWCNILRYITDNGGYIYVSSCFSGGRDGNWRFTPNGLRVMFERLEEISVISSFWETDGKGVALLARRR